MIQRDGADVIFHKGEYVLLQRRDHTPGIIFPGYWAVFGGIIEPGESPEDTAVREMQEELGVIITRDALKLVASVRWGDERPVSYYFSAELPVELHELKLREGTGFALYLHEEIDGLRMAAKDRFALERFFYEVKPGDPGTLVVTATLFLLVAVAASYLPALRATRVDPAEALRAE